MKRRPQLNRGMRTKAVRRDAPRKSKKLPPRKTGRKMIRMIGSVITARQT